MKPRLLVVVGPTASGKTAYAIRLAEALRGELVSADSRQVYRHCDIGTNKPTRGELHGIACHLIDVVEPDAPFTVADYVPLAQSGPLRNMESRRPAGFAGRDRPLCSGAAGRLEPGGCPARSSAAGRARKTAR